jgi:hypothetical protein
MRAWIGLLLLAAGFVAIVAMSEPPRPPMHRVDTPNCTSDRWDYPAGKNGPRLPEYHIGLGNGGAWNFCPDWKRRRTYEMT